MSKHFIVLDTAKGGYVADVQLNVEECQVTPDPCLARLFSGDSWRQAWPHHRFVLYDWPDQDQITTKYPEPDQATPFLILLAETILDRCKRDRTSRSQYADGNASLSGCWLSLAEVDAARHALAVARGDSHTLEPLGPHDLD